MKNKVENIPEEIKIILEKYYSGTSSLEEERKLKIFFQSNRLHPEAKIFNFTQSENSFSIDNEVIWEKINSIQTKRKRVIRQIYLVSSIAASMLIILTLGFFLIRNKNQTKSPYFTETYTDPQAAYAATQKYLSMISSKLAYAYTEIQPIEIIDLPVKAVNSLSNFDKGMNCLNKISTVYYYEDKLKYFSVFNDDSLNISH